MDLLTLALMCGPWVAPATTLSVIQVESGGHIYAIHDNTTQRSFNPATLREAEVLAAALIGAGHRVDLGLMQINYDVWLKVTHVRLDQAFNACNNIAFGTTILSAAFARESIAVRDTPEALARALSVYNSGDAHRARDYATRVFRTQHWPRAQAVLSVAPAGRKP